MTQMTAVDDIIRDQTSADDTRIEPVLTQASLRRGDYVPRGVMDFKGQRLLLNLEPRAGKITLLAFLGSFGLPHVDSFFKTLDVAKRFFTQQDVHLFCIGLGLEKYAHQFGRGYNIDLIGDDMLRISAAFGALRPKHNHSSEADFTPLWMIIDSNCRVLEAQPLDSPDAAFETYMDYILNLATEPRKLAPILEQPRVFELGLCDDLMKTFEPLAQPFPAMPGIKIASLAQTVWRDEVLNRLERRLIPEINRVFNYKCHTIENMTFVQRCHVDGGQADRLRIQTQAAEKDKSGFAVWLPLDDKLGCGGLLSFPEYSAYYCKTQKGHAVVHSTSLLRLTKPVNSGYRHYIECLIR